MAIVSVSHEFLNGKSRQTTGANRAKILATVIVGYDLDFPETMPQLNPARGEMMRQTFLKPGMAEVTAMRNGSLQGACLIMLRVRWALTAGPCPASTMRGLVSRFFRAPDDNRILFAASDMARSVRLIRVILD